MPEGRAHSNAFWTYALELHQSCINNIARRSAKRTRVAFADRFGGEKEVFHDESARQTRRGRPRKPAVSSAGHLNQDCGKHNPRGYRYAREQECFGKKRSAEVACSTVLW